MDNLAAYLFHQGTNYRSYEYLGAHFEEKSGKSGVVFRVFAPNAISVKVTGDFSFWEESRAISMEKITPQGIWEGFAEGIKVYDCYKYLITAPDGRKLYKADPFAFHCEHSGTNSKIYSLPQFKWTDKNYIKFREKSDIYSSPINIYEVHAGSWKRFADGNPYDYRTLADNLVPYIKELGYTHVELMPVTEFPFDGSWGYQVTGYFAPTSRFGTPEDFMYFVNRMHRDGIGVILDWVPGHFPKDEHGLYLFDGAEVFESQDPQIREHRGWGTMVFDFGRPEVQSFLISSAVYWFEKYHIDGLRVDAVASMLYLDYDRKAGEWHPNSYGGRESLEAIAFLRKLNTEVFARFKNIMMIAEESTAFPGVTHPADRGGLGFNFKWNMGWMNDIIDYLGTDPYFRKYNHNKLTFPLMYAFSENYILPISHDEVVHGKKSLIDKMYGDYGQKFATLRTFLSYMYSHPGKKLLFMGSEFAQFREWDFSSSLEFFMLDFDMHKKTAEFVKALNHFYQQNPQLWEKDYSWEGFEWIVSDDSDQNIIAYERKGKDGKGIIFAANYAPVLRSDYPLGCAEGEYEEIFTTDCADYGGSGIINGNLIAKKGAMHGREFHIEITLPPLSAVFFKRKEETPILYIE